MWKLLSKMLANPALLLVVFLVFFAFVTGDTKSYLLALIVWYGVGMTAFREAVIHDHPAVKDKNFFQATWFLIQTAFFGPFSYRLLKYYGT